MPKNLISFIQVCSICSAFILSTGLVVLIQSSGNRSGGNRTVPTIPTIPAVPTVALDKITTSFLDDDRKQIAIWEEYTSAFEAALNQRANNRKIVLDKKNELNNLVHLKDDLELSTLSALDKELEKSRNELNKTVQQKSNLEKLMLSVLNKESEKTRNELNKEIEQKINLENSLEKSKKIKTLYEKEIIKYHEYGMIPLEQSKKVLELEKVISNYEAKLWILNSQIDEIKKYISSLTSIKS